MLCAASILTLSFSGRGHASTNAALALLKLGPHVLQAQDAADGYVSDSAITAQMGVLNSVYNAVGFGFSLAGVDRTLNADWFQNLQSQTQEEADMTTALHKGNASVVSTRAPLCRLPHGSVRAVLALCGLQLHLTHPAAWYTCAHAAFARRRPDELMLNVRHQPAPVAEQCGCHVCS